MRGAVLLRPSAAMKCGYFGPPKRARVLSLFDCPACKLAGRPVVVSADLLACSACGAVYAVRVLLQN